MPSIYQVMKAQRLHFNTKQLTVIGKLAIARFQELHPGIRPPKIQVHLQTKKKKPFYWWILNYPDNFTDEIKRILSESAQQVKKKRKRIAKPAFTTKPIAEGMDHSRLSDIAIIKGQSNATGN